MIKNGMDLEKFKELIWQTYIGKHCALCDREYKSLEDVKELEPIYQTDHSLMCSSCYFNHKFRESL